MCKVGDVIVIDKYISDDGTVLSRHSFVVIDDNADEIKGLKYDFVANIMCSFHNEEHKNKKLKYEENFPIKEQLISGEKINNKSGYIKADQLYYFDKNLIEYQVIAHMEAELLDELVQLILVLNEKGLLKNVISNLDLEIVKN